jgi:predicted Zn-dependent protease
MISIRPIALVGAALLVLFLSASAQTAPQPTRAEVEKDPVLKAMLTELDRSKSDLQLKDFQKPFFIQYRIEDVDSFETRAEFGATSTSQRGRVRVARVTVRVGDYKSDSSSGQGDGVAEVTAMDDDPVALRSTLWWATDQAYKNALAIYAQKQAALKQVETPPQADDFSQEMPVISLAEPLKWQVDEGAWDRMMAKASGLFLTEPALKAGKDSVEYSRAYFDALATTTYLVNSEGAILRSSQIRFDEDFSVGGQAADGMRLDRSYYIAGNSPAEMDTAEAFNRHAIECIQGLAELRAAPLVEEEYHGPLLMDADAAAGTLKGLLAHAFTASRPALGTEARTNGPFASSYHARVLPDFFDVVDDPAMKSYNGKSLVGAYDVDGEGVPAQAVKLVVAGKLENYLIGREPVRDFPHSNGHGRAPMFGAPQSSIGVLRITAKDGFAAADLDRKLIDMAKDGGLPNVYFVEAMAGEMDPRLLYKVTPDGKRVLVRGARLQDLDLRTLRSGIVAAGKDLFANSQLGSLPETVLAPALLFDDVTIRRANNKNDKLPFYPPPE